MGNTPCLYLLSVQHDSLSPDRFVDVINSLKKYTVSFLWDLIALAASIYNKVCQLTNYPLSLSLPIFGKDLSAHCSGAKDACHSKVPLKGNEKL